MIQMIALKSSVWAGVFELIFAVTKLACDCAEDYGGAQRDDQNREVHEGYLLTTKISVSSQSGHWNVRVS